MTDPLLSEQYESYPYPARDPADEASRLIEGSPSHLDELCHYLLGGARPRRRPFRALFAGGGTGDGLVMLAQHCATAGIEAAITYVDLSEAARAIAEARLAARGLPPARFLTGSLLDLPALAPGPYDYIDCCGVLHHLEDPAAGLGVLAGQLAPDGGLGLMVYGAIGRTGVYPLQDALRRLGRDLPAEARVPLAGRLIEELPETNWFRRNPLLADHRRSAAGLVDLLLHGRDRAFTVPELARLLEGAGLALAGFVEPARYRPETYLTDPGLRARAAGLDPWDRAAVAEALAGNIKMHAFYAVPAGRADASVADLARHPAPERVRPVLRGIDGATLARALRPGQPLVATVDGLKLRLPVPPLAGALAAGIDGETDLIGLQRKLERHAAARLPWNAFRDQFDRLFEVMNGLGKMFLRTDAADGGGAGDGARGGPG